MANKMQFVLGDLFAPLCADVKFDVVLFNAPYLPTERSEEVSFLERAWSGGVRGRQVIDRFIVDVQEYVKRGGRILLMQSTLSNVDETLLKFEESGLRGRIVAEKNLPFFETIMLVEAVAK